MSSNSINILGEFRRLIAEGAITALAIETITGIEQSRLQSLLAAHGEVSTVRAAHPALTAGETARLSTLAVHLTSGLTIGDDDRLRTIVESLTAELHLSPQNISQLTGLRMEDLKRVLNDDRSVSIEEKYAMAIRCSYLIATTNLVRAR
ncbi:MULTISPECIES: HTH domain-containing protein [unclassified Microbacterium]|uniref:HTH domain-containing protein n=1 Tax=unclassified Microbacterium TaxID=2609290 RepID=UPI001605434A|nr:MULTISPECIES: HTH domain-containing protein [unclassified Microbacterium]QNA91638.1 hypothetical protein G4G29_02770 [Microbacterium sp. Se63.02b]QYM64820.1 hypothetical protein K1X59_02755 [Microbacterium sp. Se5.02b]